MTQTLTAILLSAWDVFLESAPYMLFGFLVAGMLKAFLPSNLIQRHLGSSRFSSVLKASLMGIPLPLCSCGVAPAAAGLRRQGASKGATASFLISTPETGVDSMAVTWALLDPVMTLLRPLSALITATLAGVGVNLLDKNGRDTTPPAPPLQSGCNDACCSGSCTAPRPGLMDKLLNGLAYAFGDLLPDIGGWFLVGVLLAGAVTALMPDGFIERNLGDGLLPLLAALAVSAPLYVCATSSTPIVAALALKGLSPGAALVFLLAGPATNLASFSMVSRIIGKRAAVVYLAAILISALLLGLGANALYASLGLSITDWIQTDSNEARGWMYPVSAALLAAFLARPFVLRGLSRLRTVKHTITGGHA
ncbi:MAG: SO_0444 family Cu/Zn efflux transporter [Desulfovibrionaceae bacterium]